MGHIGQEGYQGSGGRAGSGVWAVDHSLDIAMHVA